MITCTPVTDFAVLCTVPTILGKKESSKKSTHVHTFTNVCTRKERGSLVTNHFSRVKIRTVNEYTERLSGVLVTSTTTGPSLRIKRLFDYL